MSEVPQSVVRPDPGKTATTASFGVSSMVAPLRRVAMRRPGRATLEADPVRWHYAGPIEPDRLLRQYDAFAACVAASGAQVEWIDGEADDGLADAMFPFDPSFMTPGGAILLRPGKRLRQPEVASHEALHRRLGHPVIGAIEAPGTAEGGDLMWLDAGTLAVGRGFRTNQAGIDQLRDILSPLGIDVLAFDLPMWQGSAACLHLLSLASPLDRDLALVYPRLFPVALYELMRARGIRLLEADDEEFLSSGGLNLNVLATAPRRCIALDGFPATVRIMREAGCDVACFQGDALCIACEGGPTCLTLPIFRDDRPPAPETTP